MIASLDVPLLKWTFGDQLHEMTQQMFQFRYPRNMAFDNHAHDFPNCVDQLQHSAIHYRPCQRDVK